jgi:hypothetical protein
MRKCPFCAEDIQDAAIFCKHCQRELAAEKATTPCPFCKAPVANDSKVCPSCREDISELTSPAARELLSAEPTSAMKPSVSPVVVIVALLAAGVVLSMILSGSSGVTGPANSYLLTGSTSSGGVSLAQFQQLRDGMTYGEAVGVLGGSGTEQSRSNIADIVTVMYSWPGSGSLGANMNAMFQNDKLVVKAQFGLR